MASALTPHAFAGDPDIADLHAFFAPAPHFQGDTLWTFGTSLKSAYVNTFDFMNHTPVVQLWRDSQGQLQAVSRLSLGTGEWFHLAMPDYRTAEVTAAIVRQADRAFELLTTCESWDTVRYETKVNEIAELEALGYGGQAPIEVYMLRSLEDGVEPAPCPAGLHVSLLDESDPTQVEQRGLAQIDAFSDGVPTADAQAWIRRSLPHQLGYGRPDSHPNVIATDDQGSILAFADVFFDGQNGIGELEPVGTLTSAQRRGLSKLVLARALTEMRDAGMRQAVVRTGIDNAAAIAAYSAAGFEITDHLIAMRKHR